MTIDMIAKKMKEMQEKYNEMVLLYNQQQAYLSELKTSIDKILGGIETIDLILKEVQEHEQEQGLFDLGTGPGPTAVTEQRSSDSSSEP